MIKTNKEFLTDRVAFLRRKISYLEGQINKLEDMLLEDDNKEAEGNWGDDLFNTLILSLPVKCSKDTVEKLKKILDKIPAG